MSQTILTFSYSRGGVLTDVASAVLQDSTDTLGVVRTDTNANIVSAGTPLTHQSTGVYSYTFTDPAPGLTYTWYVTYVYSGLTQVVQFTATGGITPVQVPPGVPPLFTYQQFINKWGLKNVITATAKDQNVAAIIASGAPDPNQLADAFNFAISEVNQRFQGSIYKTPLTFSRNNGVVPFTVSNWAMTLAYDYLYNVRGYDDKDKQGNKLRKLVEQVRSDMGFYVAGIYQMLADISSDDSGYVAGLGITPTRYRDIARAAVGQGGGGWGWGVTDAVLTYCWIE